MAMTSRHVGSAIADKSLDGGRNWEAKNDGITDKQMGRSAPVIVDPEHSEVLYVASEGGGGVFNQAGRRLDRRCEMRHSRAVRGTPTLPLVMNALAGLLALAVVIRAVSVAYADGAAQRMGATVADASEPILDPLNDQTLDPIVLVRLPLSPIGDKKLRAIQSYLTVYIPAGVEVVGMRLLDGSGRTVEPRVPGVSLMSCRAGSCDFIGSIAQVYADTGFFFATGGALAPVPSSSLLTTTNGILVPTPKNVGDVAALLGADASSVHAHNTWDADQVSCSAVEETHSWATARRSQAPAPFMRSMRADYWALGREWRRPVRSSDSRRRIRSPMSAVRRYRPQAVSTSRRTRPCRPARPLCAWRWAKPVSAIRCTRSSRCV